MRGCCLPDSIIGLRQWRLTLIPCSPRQRRPQRPGHQQSQRARSVRPAAGRWWCDGNTISIGQRRQSVAYPADADQADLIYVTRVVRPSGRRILLCDVRWSTRTKCAPAPNRRSQSVMGRVAGFAWCRPTPSWWTPFAPCYTVAQATKFSRGAAASDCPPGPRPGGL